MCSDYIYEVETRFSFSSKEEAFKTIPFLERSLNTEIKWDTVHYGQELHHEDIILRISRAEIGEKKIVSLGYKEKDRGDLINIRKEYGEKISEGIENSRIMKMLGGKAALESVRDVEDELKRLGYREFMSFTGRSYIGKYEPLDLHLKLMYCDVLQYPLMLEIEKGASEYDETASRVADIEDFIDKYQLKGCLVQKEPPTLLYEAYKEYN